MGIFQDIGKFVSKFNRDPIVKFDLKNLGKMVGAATGNTQAAEQRAAAEQLEKDAAAQAAAATASIQAEAIANQKRRVGVMYTYNPTGGQGDDSKANTRRTTLGA